MHKLLQHKTLTFFLIFIILLTVSFKSLLTRGIEWYVGDLLKSEVSVNSLNLYPKIELDAYIEKAENRVFINVINEFPLEAEVVYKGNMNAFKEYVALDANTTLNALVQYDKELVINSEANVTIPAFDTLHIDSQLNMLDENLSISLEVVFRKNSEYNFDANVSKEGNNTQVNLQSDAFGGDIEALYEDDKLKVGVKKLHLSKLLQQYKVDVKVRGYISAEATVDMKTFKTALQVSSTKVTYEKEVVRDVYFDIKKLSYEKERLKLDYILGLVYAQEKLLFRGDVDYKEKIVLNATTKLFGSDTKFTYVDDKILLSVMDMKIEEVLSFLKEPVYAVGEFNLNVEGTVDNLDVLLKADTLILDKNLTSLDERVRVDIKANYTPKRVTFQTNAKAKTFELNKSDGLYDLGKKELHLKQNFKLLYEKKLLPLFADIVYIDEVLRVTSPSFGGKLDLQLKNNRVNIKMKQLKIDTIAKITNKQAHVKGGLINGKVFYDIEAKKARTNIRINNMNLKGVDLDTMLGAMGLNVFNITKSFLDDDVSKITKIEHLELDLDYKKEMIHLDDVAFSTPKYRISMVGDIHEGGDITSLDIHILDKNACSSLTQKLTGSVYDIKLDNKLSTSVDVVSSVPGSLTHKAKNIFDFATGVVDKTATFVVKKSHLSENNISLVSNIGDSATGAVSTTVGVVKLECKVVYKGLVKHPLKN